MLYTIRSMDRDELEQAWNLFLKHLSRQELTWFRRNELEAHDRFVAGKMTIDAIISEYGVGNIKNWET